MLVCSGDFHGDETRVSYRRYPELRGLKEGDIFFQLGDFGILWDFNYPSKRDAYKLKQINDKPWTTIAIVGNHENYDVIEKMPIIEKFGGCMRQCVYNNIVYKHIFIIDHITILDIEEKHILCIPNAESHDIHHLLNPTDENYKTDLYMCKKYHCWYRIIGESWWPQEKMNVQENIGFMEQHENEHFDFILSHDAPGQINKWLSYKSTEGECYLELLRRTLDFDKWFHGHFHLDMV